MVENASIRKLRQRWLAALRVPDSTNRRAMTTRSAAGAVTALMLGLVTPLLLYIELLPYNLIFSL